MCQNAYYSLYFIYIGEKCYLRNSKEITQFKIFYFYQLDYSITKLQEQTTFVLFLFVLKKKEFQKRNPKNGIKFYSLKIKIFQYKSSFSSRKNYCF